MRSKLLLKIGSTANTGTRYQLCHGWLENLVPPTSTAAFGRLLYHQSTAAEAEWSRYQIMAGPCHELEPRSTKDPPSRAVTHVKSVES
ncbi:hypothetical protein TNCV_4195251 [Trichonephila clavipes]|nr:hypothetical protein TNCV_4195251 [Trichonephila clavipes]